MKCRACKSENIKEIIDLGAQPYANALVASDYVGEYTVPLILGECQTCMHLQTLHHVGHQELFHQDYPYFTSVNRGYVEQCRLLSEDLKREFAPQSVIEIGCNDGYMLENFKDLVHLGYEPSFSVAEIAREKGLIISNEFFGYDGAPKFKADLILAFNVIGHVPDVALFVDSIRETLSRDGIVVIEIPNADNIFLEGYVDTIYHEHYSYFTAYTLINLFNMRGMSCFRLEKIVSHGGSMRAYFRHNNFNKTSLKGMCTTFSHEDLRQKALTRKMKMLDYVLTKKLQRKTIAAFGAAAKGITMINYCGIHRDMIDFCVDETPMKVGMYMPGSRIPIKDIKFLKLMRPDALIILPWNHEREIKDKLLKIIDWPCDRVCF